MQFSLISIHSLILQNDTNTSAFTAVISSNPVCLGIVIYWSSYSSTQSTTRKKNQKLTEAETEKKVSDFIRGFILLVVR